mmetsp:Transcript_7930/g.15021  ORF Transcript_7930/g.15021 Transcript_7930/m.15021 type:complete len:92 (+) Transcript_7930:200-475(+)
MPCHAFFYGALLGQGGETCAPSSARGNSIRKLVPCRLLWPEVPCMPCELMWCSQCFNQGVVVFSPADACNRTRGRFQQAPTTATPAAFWRL